MLQHRATRRNVACCAIATQSLRRYNAVCHAVAALCASLQKVAHLLLQTPIPWHPTAHGPPPAPAPPAPVVQRALPPRPMLATVEVIGHAGDAGLQHLKCFVTCLKYES